MILVLYLDALHGDCNGAWHGSKIGLMSRQVKKVNAVSRLQFGKKRSMQIEGQFTNGKRADRLRLWMEI